jgi:hypothetical protein
VFLGRAREAKRTSYGQSYALRFRVPRLRPGDYAFVIYADFRRLRGRGRLITSTNRVVSRSTGAPTTLVSGSRLRVRAERNSAGSDGDDPVGIWPIAAAGIVALSAAGIVLRRRRS